jgi:hypothetical protein
VRLLGGVLQLPVLLGRQAHRDNGKSPQAGATYLHVCPTRSVPQGRPGNRRSCGYLPGDNCPVTGAAECARARRSLTTIRMPRSHSSAVRILSSGVLGGGTRAI